MAPDLKIRAISPDVYAGLQERARTNGRSMEAELRLIVAEAVGSSLPTNQLPATRPGKRVSMPSLVLDLQEGALNPDISITDLLRKVKVAAAKLRISDILEWVTYELDGYPDDNAVIPDYREIRGIAKGFNPLQGWLKIQFENPELEERVSTQKSRQPISEIETLAEIEDGSLTFAISSAFTKGSLSYATEARIFVARSQIVRILDAAKNRVLSWALALEEHGILGEGISFSPDEKVQATNADFQFSTHYTVHGNVGILGDVSESSVTQNIPGPMDPLAELLHALSDRAAKLDEPNGMVVALAAERAAVAAASSRPNATFVERLVGGMSSAVQGIAALAPAWAAVSSEAAKLGLNIGLPGSHL